jgi:deoxyribose-phosphate aldolase
MDFSNPRTSAATDHFRRAKTTVPEHPAELGPRDTMSPFQETQPVPVSRAQLARIIDHTQLRPYATETDMRELCEDAMREGFAAVSINPAWVSYCARQLSGTRVGVNACIAFPLGASTATIKVEEARDAVRNGATEIDMVINIGALKSGYPQFVGREIAAVVKAVKGIPVKVILEMSYLSEEEKVTGCELALQAGAAYVKTSTGYGHGGATVEDVQLIRSVVGDQMGIKAAGGIRTYYDAMAMLEAGATRIGTSAGVRILDELPA